MDALPQVGQKYQHKKWGEVEVRDVTKRGRGYRVSVFKDGWPDVLTVSLTNFDQDTYPV